MAMLSLNSYAAITKRSTSVDDSSILQRDTCVDPFVSNFVTREIQDYAHQHAGHKRRQTTLTDGYVTTDDFGSDGDDTAHAKKDKRMDHVKGYRRIDRIVHDLEGYELVFRYFERNDWKGGAPRLGEHSP